MAELARVTRKDAESSLALHEESVALARELGDKPSLMYALWAMSFTLIDRQDWGRAEAVLQEHRQLQEVVGSPMGAAVSSRQLGRIAMRRGEYARARVFFTESLAQTRVLGDIDGIAIALSHLCEATYQAGDDVRARALREELLDLARTTGHPILVVHALGAIGHLARDVGDYQRAAANYRESLALRREMRDGRAVVQSLEDFAVLAGRQGQFERAARLLGAVEAQAEAIGLTPPTASPAEYERTVAMARSTLDEQQFSTALTEGRAMSLDEAVEYALAEEESTS